jgi:hypothetical protein
MRLTCELNIVLVIELGSEKCLRLDILSRFTMNFSAKTFSFILHAIILIIDLTLSECIRQVCHCHM